MKRRERKKKLVYLVKFVLKKLENLGKFNDFTVNILRENRQQQWERAAVKPLNI